jgi:cold shock protein
MATGTVKWFDPNRGYGFIRPEQGEDVFVHISAVQASGLQALQEGQAVEFYIEQGRKGTAGRQPATTAGRCVGLTRRSPSATG